MHAIYNITFNGTKDGVYGKICTKLNGSHLRVQLYAADGLAAFFKGFSPAFCRSIPANAVAFLVYEEVRQAMIKESA